MGYFVRYRKLSSPSSPIVSTIHHKISSKYARAFMALPALERGKLIPDYVKMANLGVHTAGVDDQPNFGML